MSTYTDMCQKVSHPAKIVVTSDGNRQPKGHTNRKSIIRFQSGMKGLSTAGQDMT